MTKPNGRGSDWRRTPLEDTYRVDENGCWIWQLAKTHGYGHVSRARYQGHAHRWMWLELRGPIPDGLQVDHLCRVRACVNPDHMELVTGAENRRRSDGPTGINARKTHCVKDHPFDEVNTRRGRQRTCRTCAREKARQYRARRKAA